MRYSFLDGTLSLHLGLRAGFAEERLQRLAPGEEQAEIWLANTKCEYDGGEATYSDMRQVISLKHAEVSY